MPLLLCLTPLLSRQGLAYSKRAALCAVDDHAGAASPEVSGTRPVALHEIEPGEVVEGGADGGVVGAQRLLDNRKVALVKQLGLGVAALGAIEVGEVVEGGADVG